MTSNTYIEVENQRDNIERIKQLEEMKASQARLDDPEGWLQLKDECERRYKELGRWVVDTMDDLPF